MKTITHFLITGTLLYISNFSFSQVGSPITNFSATPYTICPGETVQFTDISANNPTSWIWHFTGGSPATSTLQNPVVVYNLPGKYNVILTASNDKGTLTKGMLSMVKVMSCTHIGENEDNFNFQIFPNPALSYVNVITRLDAQFTLYNALGSAISKGNLKRDELNRLDLDNLPAGVYFFSLQESSKSKSYKFIKE